MLEKTIKTVFNKKVNDWIKSIDDERIQNIIKDNCIITGGAIISLMQNETPKDYDVYFKTKEAALAVSRYYVKKFNEAHGGSFTNGIGNTTKAFILTGDMFEISGNMCTILDKELLEVMKMSYPISGNKFPCNPKEDEINDKSYTGLTRMIVNTPHDRIKIFISSDGIAGQLEDNNIEDIEMGSDPVDVISEADEIPATMMESREKYKPVFLSSNAITLSDGIQIVIRFYGEPDKIHETYDFVHTKGYWTSYDRKIVIPKEVYEAVMNKTLIYTGSKYPVCSIIRMRKFIKRGWTINAGQILKMAMQISDLDLTNIDVLEDQLVGVDSLYFTNLIAQFREQKENNNEWNVTTGYVMSIIDKIF